MRTMCMGKTLRKKNLDKVMQHIEIVLGCCQYTYVHQQGSVQEDFVMDSVYDHIRMAFHSILINAYMCIVNMSVNVLGSCA